MSSLQRQTDMSGELENDVVSDSAQSEEDQIIYQKRSGTDGMAGKFYETKLISLLLLRALNDEDISEFYIASNIQGLGSLDDIVFKFKINGQEKSRIMFIQTKHKENPKKGEITEQNLFGEHGDFSLKQYLNSYITVKTMFNQNSKNPLFSESLENMNVNIILYTPTKEKIVRKKVKENINEDKAHLIGTNNEKIFQVDYNESDVRDLAKSIVVRRVKLLAKRFHNFVHNRNSANIMLDDLFKSYHVLFASKIIELTKEQQPPYENYIKCKFRQEFLLNTDDEFLKIFLEEVKKMSWNKNLQDVIIHLPMEFGNFKLTFEWDYFKINVCFKKEIMEMHLQKKINILHKMLTFVDSSTNIVKITDDMIGPDKMFKDKEFKEFSSLVGIILIWDEQTKMLKINENWPLAYSERNIIDGLKEHLKERDLSKYRFNINVCHFPKLTWLDEDYNQYKQSAEELLNKLTLYTNQAQESEVERIVKDKIDELYKSEDDTLRNKVKSDSIFLNVHDKILNWWKYSETSHLLTKRHNFYDQVKTELLGYPLLKILNGVHCKKIKSIPVEFEDSAIKSLGIHDFLKQSVERILIIESKQIILSSIKLLKHLETHEICVYFFIDLELISLDDYFVEVLQEIRESDAKLLLILCNNNDFLRKLKSILYNFKEYVVIISTKIVLEKMDKICFSKQFSGRIKINDKMIKLTNVTSDIRENLIKKGLIMSQGVKIPLGTLLSKKLYHLVDSEVLFDMINHNLAYAMSTVNNNYDQESYIPRKMYRNIELRLNKHDHTKTLDLLKFNRRESSVYPVYQVENPNIRVINYRQYLEIYLETYKHGFHTVMIPSFCESDDSDSEYDAHDQSQHAINYIDFLFKSDSITDIVLLFDERHPMISVKRNILTRLLDCKSTNVHLFLQISEGKYVWYESVGKLDNLFSCISRNRSSSVELKPSTVKDISDKIVIISAEPGMGKSTFLTHLSLETKKCHRDWLITKINLIDHNKDFDTWKQNKTTINLNEALNFIYNASDLHFYKGTEKVIKDHTLFNFSIINGRTHITSLDTRESFEKDYYALEVGLFFEAYKEGRLVVLFDGFDEITDYSKEIIQLLDVLKTSNVDKLWITTRSYNIVNQLENTLCTFSFRLQALTPEDQQRYLETTWGRAVGLNLSYDYKPFSHHVQRFLNEISESISDRRKEFTGNPLHVYMISEIFEDLFKNNYNPHIWDISDDYRQSFMEKLNLITLYELFVDIKFHNIRFGEKKRYLYWEEAKKDSDIRNMIKNELDEFIKNHKKLAAYSILEHYVEGVFTARELKEITDMLKKIEKGEEKTGIIDQVIDGKPRFIHNTFAEYFTTEFLYDKLKSPDCTAEIWVYLFNSVFTFSSGAVKKFFDCKLGLDSTNLSPNPKHLEFIFESITKCRSPSKPPINIAVMDFTENVAIFILKTIKTLLYEKNNLDNLITHLTCCVYEVCTVCAAVERSRKVLTYIVDLVRELNVNKLQNLLTCKDFPRHSPLMLATKYCEYDDQEETVHVLLRYIENPVHIKNILLTPLCSTPGLCTLGHIFASVPSSRSVLLEYIEKLNDKQRLEVFSVTDTQNKIPSYYGNDPELSGHLENLLSSRSFSRIRKLLRKGLKTESKEFAVEYGPEKYFEPNIFETGDGAFHIDDGLHRGVIHQISLFECVELDSISQ